MKKLLLLAVVIIFSINLSGCLLLAGAAGGGGTAIWLSGKLTEEVNYSLERSFKAAESAMNSLGYEISRSSVKEKVGQIIGNYSDGKTIWIDVHKISENRSKIEVRVGAAGDKDAARKILDKIKRYL